MRRAWHPEQIVLENLKSTKGWQKIRRQVASSSATVDFTGLTSQYAAYLVALDQILPAAGTPRLWLRFSTNNGSTYDAGATDYAHAVWSVNTSAGSGATSSTGTTKIEVSFDLSTSTTVCGSVLLTNPLGTISGTQCNFRVGQYAISGAGGNHYGGGSRNAVQTTNAIRFLLSSGDIGSGTFTLYGLAA